jgi:hypothetical protein
MSYSRNSSCALNLKKITRQVPLVEQELYTPLEYTDSLLVVVCTSNLSFLCSVLWIIVSLFCPFYVGHCRVCTFNLRHLITPLVFSNFFFLHCQLKLFMQNVFRWFEKSSIKPLIYHYSPVYSSVSHIVNSFRLIKYYSSPDINISIFHFNVYDNLLHDIKYVRKIGEKFAYQRNTFCINLYHCF